MKLIVGLGNPGPAYERTRHNIGFVVADRLAQRYAPGAVARARFHAMCFEARLPGETPSDPDCRALIIKPTTYMNRSGQSVGEALRFYKLDPSEDLLVVVDDTALPAGSFRLRAGGGAGGHNGLKDIDRALGTQKYARVRIGVDDKGDKVLSDYVLEKFAPDQWQKVEPLLPTIERACLAWAHRGIDHAMNTFNAKDKPPRSTPTPEGEADENHSDKATDAA
ncbi:MAG: aminoacyl-tRNA hydrolase [Phycisphaerales bacterium]